MSKLRASTEMQSEDHRGRHLVRSPIGGSLCPRNAHSTRTRVSKRQVCRAELHPRSRSEAAFHCYCTIYKYFSYLPSFFDFVDYDAYKLQLLVVDEVARGYNDWPKVSNHGDRFPNSSIANVVIRHVYGIMRTLIQRDLTVVFYCGRLSTR